jgi:hypothetical protein
MGLEKLFEALHIAKAGDEPLGFLISHRPAVPTNPKCWDRPEVR